MNRVIENLLLQYARNFPIAKGKFRLIERYGKGIRSSKDSMRRAQLIYGNYLMDCDLRLMLQRQFYFFGTYFQEQAILNQWSQLAKESRVILDVGANAGIYSLAAAAANPGAVIHAFEPTPDIAEHFGGTLTLNNLRDRVNIHQVAVGESAGTAYLNYFGKEDHGNEGMNFVSSSKRQGDCLAVPIISLDSFCKSQAIKCVDLIKIDVQGNEPAVLAGASALIATGAIRRIFFELNWNPGDSSNCPARKALKFLSDAGYMFSDAARDIAPVAAGPWLETLADVVATAPLCCH
jgi:FkbM family methyltransferase